MTFTALMTVGNEATGAKRIEAYGLELLVKDKSVLIDDAKFDSAAKKAGLDFEQKILTVMAPVSQPPKQLIFIPALLLLGFIIVMQRRRRVLPGTTATTPTN